MSEVNKLDSAGCPFDPNQYQVNDDNINVPAGTFAWALSLVYLGKQVYRSDWNAPKEHMRLSHESEANNGEGGGNPYIEKSDKDGYWYPWRPTQEELQNSLMACDWKLLVPARPECPEGSMFALDVELGKDQAQGVRFGYIGETLASVVGDCFGYFVSSQNKTDIEDLSISEFYCYYDDDNNNNMFYLAVSSNPDDLSKLEELISNKKSLYVTVDGRVTYNLGLPVYGPTQYSEQSPYFFPEYIANSNETETLVAIMKQTGEIKRFCFKWE
ncbi:DUF2829 domain-containing protein [Xenorhabdus sp. 18]|uniref:Thoeris anti-defense Tad2 family protein n=1 Tax=Xenorhabdus doucetiae TaxID=351671 RepID=UPI00198A94D0|nr:MW1434 family type I TA system toxin [Xenorhabdus sp. 18]MBD2796522.1 DUF2829 domain-containing protein [Xenorhabdus sp. 18]